MSAILSRPQTGGVLLLCLDAVVPAPDCDATPGGSDELWRANAARLLAHARRQGWAVGHVISRRPRPGEAPWKATEGLAPAPHEAVYHRDQPSAFASAELCASLAVPNRPEVVLCGASVRGSGLATAVDALRREAPLTLASNAIWLPRTEQPGLDALLRLQRLGHLPRLVRLADTETLMRPWRPLRLVQGGKRVQGGRG
ncbi:MAG: isochorismatase family protein [Proteobacteria bacterium]|nr:isochorismatase family protein [Pseudomonadota bacterium]